MPRITSSREYRRRGSCDGYNHRRQASLHAHKIGSSMLHTHRSSVDSSSTQSSWDSLRNYLLSHNHSTKQSLLANRNAARTSNGDQDSLSRSPSLVHSETSTQTTSSESSPTRPLTALDQYYALQMAALPHQHVGDVQASQRSYAYANSVPQQPISSFTSSSGNGTSFLPQTHCEEESWGQFVEEIEPEEIPSFNYRRYQAILNRSGRAYYR